MKPGDSVAFIGAGSLRAAGSVIASLFCTEWSERGELRLCDPHDEALDLFDRLARVLAAEADSGVRITATNRLAEAILGADFVILAVGLGNRKADWEKWIVRAKCDRDSRLAELARAILLNSAMTQIGDLLHAEAELPRVINLVRPVQLSGSLLPAAAVHVDAPAPLADDARVPAAHLALRWVKGDEYPGIILKSMEDSPILAALSGEIEGENRFDAQALRRWADEIEADAPGLASPLLELAHEP